jgi:hypothetical protein
VGHVEFPRSGKVDFRSITAALAGINLTSTTAKVEVEMTIKTGSLIIADLGRLDPS